MFRPDVNNKVISSASLWKIMALILLFFFGSMFYLLKYGKEFSSQNTPTEYTRVDFRQQYPPLPPDAPIIINDGVDLKETIDVKVKGHYYI